MTETQVDKLIATLINNPDITKIIVSRLKQDTTGLLNESLQTIMSFKSNALKYNLAQNLLNKYIKNDDHQAALVILTKTFSDCKYSDYYWNLAAQVYKSFEMSSLSYDCQNVEKSLKIFKLIEKQKIENRRQYLYHNRDDIFDIHTTIYSQAKMANESGRYDLTIKYCDISIMLIPTYSDAWELLSSTLRSIGYEKQAELAQSETIRIDILPIPKYIKGQKGY